MLCVCALSEELCVVFTWAAKTGSGEIALCHFNKIILKSFPFCFYPITNLKSRKRKSTKLRASLLIFLCAVKCFAFICDTSVRLRLCPLAAGCSVRPYHTWVTGLCINQLDSSGCCSQGQGTAFRHSTQGVDPLFNWFTSNWSEHTGFTGRKNQILSSQGEFAMGTESEVFRTKNNCSRVKMRNSWFENEMKRFLWKITLRLIDLDPVKSSFSVQYFKVEPSNTFIIREGSTLREEGAHTGWRGCYVLKDFFIKLTHNGWLVFIVFIKNVCKSGCSRQALLWKNNSTPARSANCMFQV